MIIKKIYIRKLEEIKKYLKLLKNTLKTDNEEFLKKIVESEIEEIFKLIENFNKFEIY